MRSIILATVLTVFSLSSAQAVTLPAMTFPEPGTFCGFMTLCDPQTNTAKQALEDDA